MNNPLVSIIIPTKNSGKQLPDCLEGIKRQTYKNIEIIISDGKSSDDTLDISEKYKAKIVINKKIFAEPGVRLGFKNAKGEILIVMAIDNIFKEKTAIETIVKIFKNKKIFGAFPRQDSAKEDTLFTKYTNVFTDPFNHFVYGYASNARTFNRVFKTIDHNNIYDLYDFNTSTIKPVLALAQGFSIRREFIKRKIDDMDDIAPILDLIKDKKLIAYVYSISLYHHTISGIMQFIRKQRWGARNALTGEKFGINSRKNTLSNEQKLRMYLFPIYSLSFIFPCINSIIHLVKDREIMWLFHPIIVFISGASIAYEYAKIKLGLSKFLSRL
jgi:glycosyltransferase involved in cell wall biosynthesis